MAVVQNFYESILFRLHIMMLFGNWKNPGLAFFSVFLVISFGDSHLDFTRFFCFWLGFSSIFWVVPNCRIRSSTLVLGQWFYQERVTFYSNALTYRLFGIDPWLVSHFPSFHRWLLHHHQYLVGRQTLEKDSSYQDTLGRCVFCFLGHALCRLRTELGKVCHRIVWLSHSRSF